MVDVNSTFGQLWACNIFSSAARLLLFRSLHGRPWPAWSQQRALGSHIPSSMMLGFMQTPTLLLCAQEPSLIACICTRLTPAILCRHPTGRRNQRCACAGCENRALGQACAPRGAPFPKSRACSCSCWKHGRCAGIYMLSAGPVRKQSKSKVGKRKACAGIAKSVST